MKMAIQPGAGNLHGSVFGLTSGIPRHTMSGVWSDRLPPSRTGSRGPGRRRARTDHTPGVFVLRNMEATAVNHLRIPLLAAKTGGPRAHGSRETSGRLCSGQAKQRIGWRTFGLVLTLCVIVSERAAGEITALDDANLEKNEIYPMAAVSDKFATRGRPDGRTVPELGWKIHISGRADIKNPILLRAVNVLLLSDVHFKVALAKHYETFTGAQSGKFIVVYAMDRAEAEDVMQTLASDPELRQVSEDGFDPLAQDLLVDTTLPIGLRHGALAPGNNSVARWDHHEVPEDWRQIIGQDTIPDDWLRGSGHGGGYHGTDPVLQQLFKEPRPVVPWMVSEAREFMENVRQHLELQPAPVFPEGDLYSRDDLREHLTKMRRRVERARGSRGQEVVSRPGHAAAATTRVAVGPRRPESEVDRSKEPDREADDERPEGRASGAPTSTVTFPPENHMVASEASGAVNSSGDPLPPARPETISDSRTWDARALEAKTLEELQPQLEKWHHTGKRPTHPLLQGMQEPPTPKVLEALGTLVAPSERYVSRDAFNRASDTWRDYMRLSQASTRRSDTSRIKTFFTGRETVPR